MTITYKNKNFVQTLKQYLFIYRCTPSVLWHVYSEILSSPFLDLVKYDMRILGLSQKSKTRKTAFL